MCSFHDDMCLMAFNINKLHQISPSYSFKMFNLATEKRENKIIKGEIIIFIGAMVKFIGELFITLMKI